MNDQRATRTAILGTASILLLVPLLLAVGTPPPITHEPQIAHAGPIRNLLDRWRNRHDPQPEPTPAPPTPPSPTPPSPTPPRPEPAHRALIAVWNTLDASPTLSAAAHSHDLALYLTDRGVLWFQFDPVALRQDPPPPPWVTAAAACAAREQMRPPYILILAPTQPTHCHQLDDRTDETAIRALIDEHFGPAPPGDNPLLPRRPTGLKKRSTAPGTLKNGRQPLPQLSAILKPLPPSKYPTCDLRTMFPRCTAQNGYSTCTSHSAVMMLEAIRYAQVGRANFRPLSAPCLATTINGWNGAALSDAMDALLQFGTVTEQEQPDYQRTRPANWQRSAQRHRALCVYDSPDTDTLGYLCAALARRLPAQIGISVGRGFEPDANNYISYARGRGTGGHAVIACGHDATKKPNRTLIINPWGPDWGQHGCAWIDDEFVSRSPFGDLWVMTAATISPDDTGPTPEPASNVPAAAVPRSPDTTDTDACPTCPQAKVR